MHILISKAEKRTLDLTEAMKKEVKKKKGSVNRNFPCYVPVQISFKLISFQSGENRASKRSRVAQDRRFPQIARRNAIMSLIDDQKKVKHDRIEARHEANRKRSAARKLAKKK